MKVLIVEDEPAVGRRVERLTRELLGDRLTRLDRFDSLDDARDHLRERPPDVLLLDLDLHGRDGFELLKESVAGAFHTIVVSANADRALEAFEVGVLDFVGKPFGRERLGAALARLDAARARADYALKYLAVRRHGGIDLVDVDRVVYAKGAGSQSELYLDDGTVELHPKSLDRLLELLPPVFERIHRSYVVRMDVVKSLWTPGESRYELELRDGTRLPVGRTRYREIREKLR